MSVLLKSGIIATGNPVTIFRGDVSIEDDVIAKVAPAGTIEITGNAESLDCSNMLITPGFINGHIRLKQLLNRGFLDDLSTDDLLNTMHARHEKKSDEDRYWASLVSIYEGLRCGTTYFAAFATSTGLIAQAMVDAGIRGTIKIVSLEVDQHAVDTKDSFQTDELLLIPLGLPNLKNVVVKLAEGKRVNVFAIRFSAEGHKPRGPRKKR